MSRNSTAVDAVTPEAGRAKACLCDGGRYGARGKIKYSNMGVPPAFCTGCPDPFIRHEPHATLH